MTSATDLALWDSYAATGLKARLPATSVIRNLQLVPIFRSALAKELE